MAMFSDDMFRISFFMVDCKGKMHNTYIAPQGPTAPAATLCVTDKGEHAAYGLHTKPADTRLQPLQPNDHTQLWSAV